MNDVTASLKKKFNPARFPGMSPFMAAIVGFVLGESYTDPAITVSEAENRVYIRKAGGVGFDGLPQMLRGPAIQACISIRLALSRSQRVCESVLATSVRSCVRDRAPTPGEPASPVI